MYESYFQIEFYFFFLFNQNFKYLSPYTVVMASVYIYQNTISVNTYLQTYFCLLYMLNTASFSTGQFLNIRIIYQKANLKF